MKKTHRAISFLTMNDNRFIKEVQSIDFGIYSSEEIRNMSVAHICNTKLSGNIGTVYDDRMGTIENGIVCETCKLGPKECPGHFGHIELNENIINPLFYKEVRDLLCCFCIKCCRLLVSKDQIVLNRYGKSKLNNLLKTRKIDECSHCNHPQPEFKYSPIDNSISMVYKQSSSSKISIVMSVDEIKNIFDRVLTEDIVLLGMNPEMVRPANFIMSVFPVLPTSSRPYVKTDGVFCDDDLTNQLIEIIKANNHLSKDEPDMSESKQQKYLQSLKFRIFTFYNNSSGRSKHSTSGRAIKGIKERITGKQGQIRSHLLGKRCNQTGRTVIGPDPCLKTGQLAVPVEMAEILTVPVCVNNLNMQSLMKVVNDGKANYVLKNNGKIRINLNYALNGRGTELVYGDEIHRNDKVIKYFGDKDIKLSAGDKIKRNGFFIEDIKYAYKKKYELEVGDIVERHLKDGDFLLLNRQPTLHAGSMMAHQVVIKPNKNLRFNLACNKSYNADFDGDEMNVHACQSLEARAELEFLSAIKYRMISAQSSKPNMCIVQDSLLGAYRMTLGDQKVRKEQFFDISMRTHLTSSEVLSKIQHIRKIMKIKNKKVQCFNGKGLFSLALPNDLNYEKHNNINPDEPTVKIYRGVMYEGTLDKNILGATHNSLIQIIHKEYGADASAQFIDNVQFITNAWLLLTSFSITLGDCVVHGKKQTEEIEDVVQKCYIEAECIKKTTIHAGVKEMRITSALSKAKDMGLRIAKESLSSDNNFLSTVRAQSKGDWFNLCQITGLLAQQNLVGQRVKPVLNNGQRSLPHYPFGELPLEMEYESKGFISSSFIKGLNPREFYFHAMSGREGVCDKHCVTKRWLPTMLGKQYFHLVFRYF